MAKHRKKRTSLLYTLAIIVFCIAAVLVVVSVYFSFLGLEMKNLILGDLRLPSCDQLFKGIEEELESLNYCNQDSDCKTITLNNEFGCFRYINKDIDPSGIARMMRSYNNKCGGREGVINVKCEAEIDPRCITGKCVVSIEE